MTVQRLGAPIPLALAAASAVGVAVALVPSAALMPVLALALGAPVLLAVARWPWLLIYIVVLSSALAGLLGGIEQDLGGGVSGSGARTLAIAVMVGAVGVTRLDQLRLWPAIVPWAVFASWSGIWWLANGGVVSGFKDVALYLLPLLIAIVGAAVMRGEPVISRERLDRLLVASLVIPFAIYAISTPAGLIDFTRNGPKGILGGRPVATYALLILCVALPRWRYRMAKWQSGRVASLLALGLVAFTFSRLALATAPLLLLVGGMRPRRLPGNVLRLAVAGVVALLLLISLPGVRERMFVRPPEELVDIPQSLNVSGRDVFWSVTLERWSEQPWFGRGPGHLRQAIADSRYWPGRERPPREYPPHNEYLQVLHDAGAAGLILLVVALGAPLVWHYRRWVSAVDRADPVLASAHLTAVLGMTVIVVNSLADNTLHYITVTGPVFLLMASAWSLESRSLENRFLVSSAPASDGESSDA